MGIILKVIKIQIILILLLSSPFVVMARSVEEIESEIIQKQKELEELNNEVDNAKSDLNSSIKESESAQGRIAQLESQIVEIEDQVAYNELRTKQIADMLELKNLEMEIRDAKQDKQIKAAYLNWKASNEIAQFLTSDDFFKSATYYESVANEEQTSIEELALELNKLKDESKSFEEENVSLAEEIKVLDEKKAEIKKELEAIQKVIAEEAAVLGAKQDSLKVLSSQIDQLNEEQKLLREIEEQIINDGGGGGGEIIAGELYFSGRGRDSYQGHGIGYSQNGALGAALAGWNYKQIVEFYFPGAKVTKLSSMQNISVQGYGTMTIEEYAAGLGEVPSLGCEDLGVDFGQNGYWACWPKEAIKSQIVSARSYALTSAQPICTTAACQVYHGGDAKKNLVAETDLEVATLNGQIIRAFYSSQNNQGYGTANNDTVWANREGDGSAISYLRSVNDNSFYYPASFSGCGGDCAQWWYNTNSYTIDEIQGMFEWSITSPSTYITSSDRTFLTDVMNDIGELQSISFERDPSNRVNKVVVSGPNGSRKMGGWFFKSLWNIWVDYTEPEGNKGFIYSLTYFMRTG